jgi:hypothetical protein
MIMPTVSVANGNETTTFEDCFHSGVQLVLGVVGGISPADFHSTPPDLKVAALSKFYENGDVVDSNHKRQIISALTGDINSESSITLRIVNLGSFEE